MGFLSVLLKRLSARIDYFGSIGVVMGVGLLWTGSPVASAAPPHQNITVTTLVLSAGGVPVTSVPSGTVVTFTATVIGGPLSGQPALTTGQVNFCEGNPSYPYNNPCSDAYLLGTAQRTNAGIVTFKFIPGPGTHSYYAMFRGTNLYTGSDSGEATLTVVGPSNPIPATVALQASGIQGDYTLTATVSSPSSPSPTGTVSFLDTTNANYQLASGTLASTGITGVAFRRAGQTLTGPSPVSFARSDFNGDGIPDVVDVNSNGSVDILLGNGDGTFVHSTISGVASLVSVVTGDFDSDGKSDFAIATARGIVTIYLGNGDGTFRQGQTYAPVNSRSGGGYLATADFNGDGIPDFAVTTFTGGGAGVHAVNILLGNGDGTFTQAPAAPMTGDGIAILATCLRGNCGYGVNADLVVANQLANSLTILLGNGDGSFATPVTLATVGSNAALASADLNGDGWPDLVVEDNNGDPPTVLLGKGDGTFTTLQPDPTITAYPYAIALADMNGDRIPDLIMPNVEDQLGTVNVYLGRGDGTFSFDTSSPAMTGYDAYAIATGDFVGDGQAGFALLMQNERADPVGVVGSQVAVWTGLPFTTAITSVSNISPVGTGEHDLVASYLGDTNYGGTVSPPQGVIAQLVPTTSALSVNPTTSTLGQNVTLTVNITPFTAQDHSAGSMVTFTSGSQTIGTGNVSNGVATLTTTALPAGFDNLRAVYAGDIDFAGSSSNVVSYFVAGAPSRIGTTSSLSLTAGGVPVTSVVSRTLVVFTATVTGADGSVPFGQVNFCDATALYCTDVHLLGTAQVTRSGTATIKLVPTVGPHTYRAVFLANSSYQGSVSSNATLQVASLSIGPTINTLVASGQPGNYTLTAIINARPNVLPTGLVSFADTTNANYPLGSAPLQVAPTGLNVYLAATVATPNFPYSLVEADFNGDGIPDVAVAVLYGESVSVFLGNGDGTFRSGGVLPLQQDAGYGLAAGDVNGDGCADLVALNYNEYTGNYSLVTLPGNCDGTFGAAINSKPLSFPGYYEYYTSAILLTDLNGDGKLDVALAEDEPGQCFVIAALGNGDGTFSTVSRTPTGNAPIGLVSGDFNSDGHPDIVTVNQLGTLSFLFGNGDGTFSTGVDLTVATGLAAGIVTADFNGDGKPDLAVTASNDNKVVVLLGNGDGTFTAAPSVAVGASPQPIAFADFNGDGFPDLAVGNTQDGTVSILLGKGDGTFQSVIPAPQAGSVGSGLVTGDYNSDGVPDLLLTSGNSDALTTLLAASQTTATISGVSIVGTGTHYAQASYPGDSANLPSLSNLAPLTAEPVATALSLAVSPASSTYGQPVTLSAVVAPTTAQNHIISGTVTFMNGPAVLGTVGINSNGNASLTTTALPAGSDGLTATYNGDDNFAPSSSTGLTYQVAPAAQTITFPQPAMPAYAGTSIVLTATASSGLPVVYAVISGPAVVTGSVLSYTGIGTVVIEADQSGGSGYLGAPPVQVTVAVVSLSEPVKTTSPVISTVVTFASAGTLGSIHVLTQGAQNLDFNFVPGGSCAPGATYTAGQTCSVLFTFTPIRPGIRYGGITLTTSAGAFLGNEYIYGTGTGPLATWNNGVPTILASGFQQSQGIAFDGAGNLFVTSDSGFVKELTLSSGYASTVSIGSGFIEPRGIAVDGNGNVFVADTKANTVTELLATGGYAIAATLGSGFNGPTGIAVDGYGNVFVADELNNAVKEITVASAYTHVVTIGGSFQLPLGVALDGNGNLFVADNASPSILEILAASGYTTVKTIANVGPAEWITVDDDENLFVSTSIPRPGTIELFAASGYTASKTLPGGFAAIALDGTGNFYGVAPTLGALVKLDYADPPTLTFATTPIGQTSSDSPQTVTLTNGGNEPLLFSVPASGNNPTITPGFTIASGSTCPQLTVSSSAASLAVGNSCNYQVSFAPLAGGLYNGFLVPTDNNLNVVNATQTVLLNGTGTTIAPTITFSVPNHTYGDPPFTVAASSNSQGAFTYSVVSGPATILGSTVTLTGAGTVTLLASEVASGAYSAGSQTATFTVGKQDQTINFVRPASPVNFGIPPVSLAATASSGLPVSFSVLSGPATVSGNTLTFTATGTVVVAADQAGSSNYNAAVEITRPIVVLGPLVSVGLTASPNPVFLRNPLSLAVTLAATGGIPTGSVTFLDGTSPLGTVAISGSSATLITTALTLGVHSITAIYSGDNVFAQLTSSPVTVTVQDFTLTAANPSVTIDHGGTATYNLILSSVGGIGMASTVNLSISGAPDHSEIAFTPSVVPSGSGPTSVTLVIHTPNYPVGPWSSIQKPAETILVCMTLGALFLPIPKRKRLLPRPAAIVKSLLVLTVGFASLVGLFGCGSGWRTQVWTMQVTATSGALSRSTTLTLTSQCSDGRAACPVE